MSSDEFISVPASQPTADEAVSEQPQADEATADSVGASVAPGEVPSPQDIEAEMKAEIDTSFDTVVVTAPRSPDLYSRSLANAVLTAQCADEMRARDVVVLDLTKIASIVDFFVIATGTSRRQMHAIADEVNRKLKWEGQNDRLGIEGYRTEANWVLMDFGDVVLHVFTEEGRALYDLENLKADAVRVDWKSLVPEAAQRQVGESTTTKGGESTVE